MKRSPRVSAAVSAGIVLLIPLSACTSTADRVEPGNPYAEYVWPAPPDEARIGLTQIIRGRIDVEAGSGWSRALFGASPHGPYDYLKKPFAVAFDSQGRILVSDSVKGVVIRFDRQGRRMDVFGSRGATQLKTPLGLDVGPEDAIFVADVGLGKVVSFDSRGKVRAAYGRRGELVNPTDAALSPDGTRLYVTDSKTHKILVFDSETAELLFSFGQPGDGEGEFAFPTSLAFDGDGNLYVVDQINARLQLMTAEGKFLRQIGDRGTTFGKFVRPKDVAVDEVGNVYVTDNAFNNLQIFDREHRLLTFVGEGGTGPGRFHGASGVAVRDREIAIVDQLGGRVQVFRYLASKSEE